jgi:hypothetical protein
VTRDDVGIERRTLLDVRLNEELAARLEQPRDLSEEGVAHHEALLVALLPPRVREVEEHAADRMIGTKARKRVAGVFAEDVGTCSKALLREPLVSDGGPFAPDLEADERGLGRGGCALEEKAGLRARADLELDP